MSERQLLNGTVWSGFYRISAIGIAFLISVVSARLLSVDGYGTLQFILSVAQLAQLGLGLGMTTQVLLASSKEEGSSDPGVLDILIKRSIALFIILMFLAAMPGLAIWSSLEGSAQLALLGTTAAFVMTQHLVGVYSSALVGKSRFMAAGFGEFLASLSTLVLLAGLLVFASTRVFPPAVVLLVRTGTAALGSLFLFLSWKTRRDAAGTSGAPVVNRTAMVDMARVGFPVMLIGIGAVCNSSADIILLGLMRSSTEVGHYHVATRAAGFVALPLTVMIVPLSPMISKLHLINRRELKAVFVRTTAMVAVASFVIAGLLLLLLRQFLGLFGPDFQGATHVTIFLVAIQVLNVCFGPVQHLLVMTGHQTLASRAMLFGVATNVTFNLLLIPHYGAVGAAIATGIGILVWNVFSMMAARTTVFRDIGPGVKPGSETSIRES